MEADDDPGIGGAHAPTTTMMDYPPFLSDFTSKSATLQVFQGDEDEQQQLSAKNMTGNGRWLVADQPYKPSKMAASTSATTPTALIATSLLGGAGAGAGGGTGGETEGVWASYQPGEGAHGPLNPGLELSDHHTSGGSTLQSYSGLLHPVSSETTSSAADEPSSINRTNNNYTSDIRSSTSIAAAVGGDSFSTNNSNSVNSSTNPPVSSSSPSSFSSSNSPSSSSSDTFLGFPPHILSDILSPKAALCDRKFQLTIDGITFLGSPTLLNHGDKLSNHQQYINQQYARRIQKRRHAARVNNKNANEHHQDEKDGGGGTSPTAAGCNPTTTTTNGGDANMNYSNNNTDSTLPSSSNNLTMFNLVFAFTNNNNNNNTHYNPNSKYSTTNTTTSSIPTNISKEMIDTALYKHILAKITAALKYEQVKRQYVRKEVETIMAVKEQCLNMWFDNNTATTGADASKTSGAFAGNGGGNGCGSTGASGSVGDQQNNAIAGAASNTASTSATTNLFLSTSNPTSSSITNNCSTTNNITSSNPPFLPTSTTSSNNSNNSKTNYSPHVEIRHRILAASSLARTMAHLFHAVTDNTMAHLVVNSSIDLALLPCFYEKPFAAVAGGGNTSGDKTDGEAMSGGGVMGGGGGSLVQSSVGTFASLKDEEGFLMRPYKALLLLYDPEEIVKGMPWDPSPLLVQLVQIVTPAICFEELQSVLDCSLSQIYRLAAHLVMWKQAKIIDVISLRNVYIISPAADLHRLITTSMNQFPPLLSSSTRSVAVDEFSSPDADSLAEQFSNQFPGMDLPSLLSELCIAKPYSAVVPAKENRTIYLEMLTFLLRQGLVKQLHMYIYISVPEHVRRKVRLSQRHNHHHQQHLHTQLEQEEQQSSEDSDEPYLIPDPMNPTYIEAEYLAVIAALQPPPLPSLFLRIAPYLNGRYHIGEISYRESVPKKDLRLLLNRYREQLITILR